MIAYTYVGFPLLAAARALARPQHLSDGGDGGMTLSLIVAAHNEEKVIVEKLENTLDLDYPPDLLEVVVAADGCDDGTVARAEEAMVQLRQRGISARVLDLTRMGKNDALNQAVAVATHEILVFTDADINLASDALRHIAAAMSDPGVGGVAGDLRHASRVDSAAGEHAYWSFERTLKSLQTRGGSVTSAAGGVHALRRSLFEELPRGVTDDFFISVQAPRKGYRLVFAPHVVSVADVAESSPAEMRRKTRIITAGLRGVWKVRSALDPRTHGWFAIQLLTHKVLRRLMVFPLLVVALSTPALARSSRVYRLAAGAQLLVYGLGALGTLLRDRPAGRSPAFVLPAYFVMVNLASLYALRDLVRGSSHDTWVPERRTELEDQKSPHGNPARGPRRIGRGQAADGS